MKVKSLLTQYFQGEQVYNYGGQVPPILFPDPTPSPTPSHTSTPAISPSPTPTHTTTPTNTKTPTPTPTITSTNTSTPTNTPTNTKTPTPTRTSTQTPTPTNTSTPTPTPTPLLFTYQMSDCISGGTSLGNYTNTTLMPGDVVRSYVDNRCYTILAPNPFFTPIAQTLAVGTFGTCNSCIGYNSFTGLLFNGSSAVAACSGISTPDAWGNNSTWEMNTILYSNPYTLTPYPVGYLNYGGIVLQIGAGGNVLSTYYCNPTPTPTATLTQTPTTTNTPTPSKTQSIPVITPSPTPDATSTPTPSVSPSSTPSQTPTNTPSNTASNTPTPSVSPTSTPSQTPTNTSTPTTTPTPTDSRACKTYTIANNGFSCSNFSWTNCDGTSGSDSSLCFGASTTICAKQGSVSDSTGTGIITDIGTCPLPTPTPTPTNTQTPTTTPTNTITPSITPTKTTTQTPTPTSNAACPNQLDFSTNASGLTGATGTYTRITTFNCGNNDGGYVDWNTSQFVCGALSGNTYSVWGRFDGNYYWSIEITNYSPYPGTNTTWNLAQSTGNYCFAGGIGGCIGSLTTTGSTLTGGIYVPKPGTFVDGTNRFTFTYPLLCPTPTPTRTLTPTPTKT